MYLGLSPYDAPATYSLLQYTELADGVWFPMGGLYRVIESLPGIALLNPDGRFAIGAAAELYWAILGDIAAHDYDVFHRRAHIGTWGKLRRLPGIWWRVKRTRDEGCRTKDEGPMTNDQ